jgi:Ion channel
MLFMTTTPHQSRSAVLHMEMTEFWSGDFGLTLVSVSLILLIFLIIPLRKAGVPGHFFFDVMMVTLMVSGALSVRQSRVVTAIVIATVIAGACALWASRLYPSPFLQQLSSVFSIVTMLFYVRIVLLVMFRDGPVTWSRIQGGIAAYLLLGLAWSAAFQLVEQLHAGSFHFVTAPADIDQLTGKLIYFSFATLTTVGYGDVTPLEPFARSLAIAEAIVGQLYPAILIGSLVAMAMQSRPKS